MPSTERTAFVPKDFKPPPPPRQFGFSLVPLRLEHNERDLDAWSSSVNHIHATPGFAEYPWPDEPMTLERNAKDLTAHEDDFANLRGFTYSVISDVDDEVIGCVYIYPSSDVGVNAEVRSWVRATQAERDVPLYGAVLEWLRKDWPFTTFTYASRPAPRVGI
jgi:RimJ/RimL family protein N-acetyltransferase